MNEAGQNKQPELSTAVKQADSDLVTIEGLLGIHPNIKETDEMPEYPDMPSRLDQITGHVLGLGNRLAEVKRRLLNLQEAIG